MHWMGKNEVAVRMICHVWFAKIFLCRSNSLMSLEMSVFVIVIALFVYLLYTRINVCKACKFCLKNFICFLLAMNIEAGYFVVSFNVCLLCLCSVSAVSQDIVKDYLDKRERGELLCQKSKIISDVLQHKARILCALIIWCK
jgi:hypothetical protein